MAFKMVLVVILGHLKFVKMSPIKPFKGSLYDWKQSWESGPQPSPDRIVIFQHLPTQHQCELQQITKSIPKRVVLAL